MIKMKHELNVKTEWSFVCNDFVNKEKIAA